MPSSFRPARCCGNLSPRVCLSLRERALKKGDWRLAEARRALGECLTRLARFTEAELLLIELANVEEQYEASESRHASAIQCVADLYTAWHEAEPGMGYDAKAAEWRAKLPAQEKATEGDGNQPE